MKQKGINPIEKPLIMKTFIIYITSFAGLENEYETRYEVVSDCFGNALNYAKGKHPHSISEYNYWTLDTDNWND